MKRFLTKTLLFFISILGLVISSCGQEPVVNEEHKHTLKERVIEEGDCLHPEKIEVYCSTCNEIIEIKDGDLGDHNLGEKFVQSEESKNNFSKIQYCTVCEKEFETEEVYFKDHHYVLENETKGKVHTKTYKCIVCGEVEEYVFNIDDFDYAINLDGSLKLTSYYGNEPNVLLPKEIDINGKKYSNYEVSTKVFNSNATSLIKLKVGTKLENSNISIADVPNLVKIDFSESGILNFINIVDSLPSLNEVIFPNTLLSFKKGFRSCPKLNTLDFSNTSLEYFYDDENLESIGRHIEKLILPPTVRNISFSGALNSLKEVIIDAKDLIGSIFRGYDYDRNLFDENKTLEVTRYEKQNDYMVNVTLIYPDDNKEVVRLPYGINLFENYQFKDNKKYGWYFDENCFDYFLGVIPSYDITLYGMELDDMDETFINKHQYLFVPEIKDDEIIVDDLHDFIAIQYYMISNDIYDVNINIVNPEISTFDIQTYIGLFGGDVAYIFPYAGVCSYLEFVEDSFPHSALKMTPYEEYREEAYDLDSVVIREPFDYKAPFKDFNYGTNNRSEDFKGFKSNSYKYVKEDVTNATIMSYMMSVGIKVIPKEGSLAERTLNIFKDMARHIFNDSMSGYEKVVACNLYYNYFYTIDDDPRAAYNTKGNGYFSDLLEELPFHGTINCGSGVYIPRLLYALEGLQIFSQSITAHEYGVMKIDGKFYVADHTQEYWVFEDDKNYNPLRGYDDLDYLWYEQPIEYKNSIELKNRIEIIKNITLYYPGIHLEKNCYKR